MTAVEALLLGCKKGTRFYGRSGRQEFWYFLVISWFLLFSSLVFSFVPVIGSLIQALWIISVILMQCTAIVRRMHDTNRSGKIVALPVLLILTFFIALFPVHALLPDIAWPLLGAIAASGGLSYLYLMYLCAQPGTSGNNRYGTDPLNVNEVPQDFINPRHLEMPEYLGDPWRKFKDRVQREQEQKQASATASAPIPPATVSVPSPVLKTSPAAPASPTAPTVPIAPTDPAVALPDVNIAEDAGQDSQKAQ